MQPHQQRVLDEKVELGIKLEALLGFMQTGLYSGLSDKEKELLYFQSQVMEDYYEVLEQRIELF